MLSTYRPTKAQLEAFRQLCRAKRSVLKPEDVGLPKRTAQRGPTVPGLTQPEVDTLMRRGFNTYARYEQGRRVPSPAYLLELAVALRFKESEYRQAHMDLYGTTPAPLDPEAGLDVTPDYKTKIEGQRAISYLNDHRWNLRYHNEAFRQMMPSGKVPSNMAEWFLFSAEARSVLAGYFEFWAPKLVPQFRASVSASPNDPHLLRLRDRLLRDERLAVIYNQGDNAYIHPDGDRRPMNHGTRGFGWAVMLSARPEASPLFREMTITFHPDPAVALYVAQAAVNATRMGV
ncbi:helix-turn-helix domain-containing protein [Streptomyces chrestomyceticus]|uniref:helix-turn-helix domain-containing protein n=1 Tax=Streptomyces chrestomyceticus TaxID=68185 RepID=UPI0037B2B404